MEVITNLPNTQRQNGGTKKYAPNERTREFPRKKESNEMEATKIPDAEFKTMVIRMIKDLKEWMISVET